MPDTARITFVASGRGPAQCASNPKYPEGIDVDVCLFGGAPACSFTLPYPAPECGHWDVVCTACRARTLVSAAGRPDDPRSVKVPCHSKALRN